MGGQCRTAEDEEALMKEWAAAATGRRARSPSDIDDGSDSDSMAAEWEAMLGPGGPGDRDSSDTAKDATRVLTADEIDSLLGFDDDGPRRRILHAPTRLRRLDRDGEGARNEGEPGEDSGGEEEGEADGLERRRSEDVCAWLAALHMLFSIHAARLRSLCGFEGAGGKDGVWAGGSARLLAQEIPHARFLSEEDREDAARICAFALPERGFDEFDMAAADRLHDAAEALGDMRERISWLLRPHEPRSRDLLLALDRAGESRTDRIASVPEAARRFARAMAHPTKTVDGLFDAMKLSAHERLDILSCARTRAGFGAEPDDDGDGDGGDLGWRKGMAAEEKGAALEIPPLPDRVGVLRAQDVRKALSALESGTGKGFLRVDCRSFAPQEFDPAVHSEGGSGYMSKEIGTAFAEGARHVALLHLDDAERNVGTAILEWLSKGELLGAAIPEDARIVLILADAGGG